MSKNNSPTYEIFGITKRESTTTSDGGKEKRSYWTRLGVGFTNKDESVNLKFDYLPANGAKIQLRKWRMKTEESPVSEMPTELTTE